MGRLSTFAKNRILNLRFQKSFRIKQIALTLQSDDNIKVSRKSISTFLKKYIETKSIHDKPRSGRNKKLTPEEINLIGEVTRLNRDITAPKIKEYLNLNVSTYTILRASKLFAWNKLNPNSNEAKKAAALERQLNGEAKKRKTSSKKTEVAAKMSKKDERDDSAASDDDEDDEDEEDDAEAEEEEKENETFQRFDDPRHKVKLVDPNLNLIKEADILLAKNVSSSPMVFATKVLYMIYDISELIGHNVSGKTFNKFIKNKQALDERRINYIRWLIENHFEHSNKEELWKSCRTAINKSIRNNELKGLSGNGSGSSNLNKSNEMNNFKKDVSIKNNKINNKNNKNNNNSNQTLINLQPNMSIFQITNDMPQAILDVVESSSASPSSNANLMLPLECNKPTLVTLTDSVDLETEFIQEKDKIKLDSEMDQDFNRDASDLCESKLDIINESEIEELRNLCCSPMIFSTKLLLKVFSKEELVGHNVSGKTFQKNIKNKLALDEERINYIKWLVEKHFDTKSNDSIWKSCRKAINRVIRNFEIKESKLIKSIEDTTNSEEMNYHHSNLDSLFR